MVVIFFQYIEDTYNRKQKYFISQAHMLLCLKDDLFTIDILFHREECFRIKFANLISDVSLSCN